MIWQDDKVQFILKPSGRIVLWQDAGPWKVEHFDVSASINIASDLYRKLQAVGNSTLVSVADIPEGFAGLLYVDGAFVKTLSTGKHAFWSALNNISVKSVDTRLQALDVTGQEILTKDRVTLRVNLSADYYVADPVKAIGSVKDHKEALHRSLQFAFRKTLGAKTLDELLSEKVSVDAEAAAVVRKDMAKIGLTVEDIALKDVILPGDMRDILTSVVAAQKEAEANVIRRREETNATRSLLNTAKVMAENPVMLRLKELEALESIACKVEHLTVTNGTSGLMNELVKLSD